MTDTFFVLSSGRSGTETLSLTFSQADGCRCLHEPHPQLVRESALFSYGKLDRAVAAERIMATRTALFGNATIYGETANRLSLMLPAIIEAFPDAKFLWLLRDGRDVVSSELQRGAYLPRNPRDPRVSKWHRWELNGARAGEVPAPTWRRWERFEKVCWWWGHVNNKIHENLVTLLDEDQWRLCRIEDFANDVESIGAWLGFEPTTYYIPRANRRQSVDDPSRIDPRHPNAVEQVLGWDSWSSDEREVFASHAGPLMDRIYPTWRTLDEWQEIRATPPPVVDEPADVTLLKRELDAIHLRSMLDSREDDFGYLMRAGVRLLKRHAARRLRRQ